MHHHHHHTQKMDFDAIIIGAGFGGLYSLKKLRDDFNLKVRAFDRATEVGGTWFWNQYPGALSDSETHLYCYSWDKELLQEMEIKRKYISQPDVLAYLKRVADKHDLRKDIQFETGIRSAYFDEENSFWNVTTENDEKFTARFLITALGLLAAPNLPKIKGIETFKGELHHTSRWPKDVTFSGKRVGVIGTGSTGVQVITAIASQVKHLTVFQRSAQYSVPIGNVVMSETDVAKIKENYDQIWENVWNSALGYGLNESTLPTMSVSAEERDKIFEKAWQEGGGFRFMFETFGDIAVDETANIEAQNFIKKKISEIVKDPFVAKKLTPTDLYACRPLCDSGYYEIFNRDNVSLEDVKANPIVEIKEDCVVTADGVEHKLDMLICATGFDAVDGSYKRIDIRGKDGISIKDHWKDGPNSYLGMMVSNFPNMFMVFGPNGPLANSPPIIETQVRWIADLIGYAEDHQINQIEATKDAVDNWTNTCSDIANKTLFAKAKCRIFGANVPGKKNTVYLYMGGLKEYRNQISEVSNNNYKGCLLKQSVKKTNLIES
uniref:Putative flavin-binding monooxygenase n=1 Tax=Acinetobacter calcoaceticus TaxID=471 RepID=UPI003B642BCC